VELGGDDCRSCRGASGPVQAQGGGGGAPPPLVPSSTAMAEAATLARGARTSALAAGSDAPRASGGTRSGGAQA